jgi:AcrR family transcriptional regulator
MVRRARILSDARRLLGGEDKPTVAEIAAAAGVSKGVFYREFASRAALLDALELEPETGARDRILEAGLEMVGTHGLSALSMDDLAAKAGVSRATLYRLFPGKPALFVTIIRTYSPLEPVSRAAVAMQDQPPSIVMPELARIVYRVIAGPDAPGIGLLRAVFFEVSSLSPDAEEAAHELAVTLLGSVGAYVLEQMALGRLRPMHPLLAMQLFMGPIVFHLLTRSLIEKVLVFDIDGEASVTTLAEAWLRAMDPSPSQGETHE